MTDSASNPATSSGRTPTENDIRNWMVEMVQQHVKLHGEEVRTDVSILSLGIDSMHLLVLVGELEDWVGRRFLDNPLATYSTIDSLSCWLARELREGRTQLDPRKRGTSVDTG